MEPEQLEQPRRRTGLIVGVLVLVTVIIGVAVFLAWPREVVPPAQIQSTQSSGAVDASATSTASVSVDTSNWQTYTDSTTGFSFKYPTFGQTSRVVPTSDYFGNTVYNVELQGKEDPTTYNTAFWVTAIPNTKHQTLDEWFTSNIDYGNLLLTSGAFTRQQLPNGFVAYVLTGVIPDAYDGGPVQSIFAIDTTGDTIFSFGWSQDYGSELKLLVPLGSDLHSLKKDMPLPVIGSIHMI